MSEGSHVNAPAAIYRWITLDLPNDQVSKRNWGEGLLLLPTLPNAPSIPDCEVNMLSKLIQCK